MLFSGLWSCVINDHFIHAVQHSFELTTREQIEADGCNSEECRFLHWKTEDEWGEGRFGKKCDGKYVCRAVVWHVVFLPYDGTDLLRSFRQKAEWHCPWHRFLIDGFSCFLVMYHVNKTIISSHGKLE